MCFIRTMRGEGGGSCRRDNIYFTLICELFKLFVGADVSDEWVRLAGTVRGDVNKRPLVKFN